MIGIKAISTYLPDGRVDNLERAHALGSTPDQIQTRIGFETLAIKAPCETTLGMAQRALTTLLHDQGLAPDAIDVLVVLTQNPDRPIPHLSAELHGTAKLSSRCACFDVSLGCSGYVYGLSIVSAFMQANGYTCGVLVTADPYSGIIAPQRQKHQPYLRGWGYGHVAHRYAHVHIGSVQFWYSGYGSGQTGLQ
ncbi:hypothetical protein [Achromobacter xylosoxidans]|uniref:hypothetical protein n=1 Tax=Alcaligenes xylosoxydans xylosoxydans TaxID=85698 RepID=UPI001F13FA52|nr:hypothetical protein [Achromobacter xylosoxidans]